jgi:hypothetical protein
LWPESFLFSFYDGVQLTHQLNHLAVIFLDSDVLHRSTMRCRSSLVMGQFIPTRGNPIVAPLSLFVMAPSRYTANGMCSFPSRRDNEPQEVSLKRGQGSKMNKPELADLGWLGPKDEMDRASHRFGKCSECHEIICVEKAVTDGPSTLGQTSERLVEAFRRHADLMHLGAAK